MSEEAEREQVREDGLERQDSGRLRQTGLHVAGIVTNRVKSVHVERLSVGMKHVKKSTTA